MKKAIAILIIALAGVALGAQAADGPFFFEVSTGFGISSYALESLSGKDFGQEYFSDSSLFSSEMSFDFALAKRVSLGIDYYLSDSIAMHLGVGYSNKPFIYRYVRDTAPSDYIFTANYEMLEFSLGFKAILWRAFYVGSGATYNHLIGKDAYEHYNKQVITCALSLAEDNVSAYLDIGAAIRASKALIFLFGRINGDIGKIFPYYWDISKISMIDLTLNVAVSVPL